MKILRFVESMDLRDGGPPAGIARLDIELRKMSDTEVVKIAYARRGATLPLPHPQDHTFSARSVKGRMLTPRGLRAAWEQSKDCDVIVVHGFYLWCSLIGWVLSRWRDVPLVLQPHGVFEQYQEERDKRSKRVWNALIGHRILRDVSMFLVASESEVAGVRTKRPSAAVEVVRIGVDAPTTTGRRLRGRSATLITLSRIAEKKRIDISIETVKILLDRGLQVSLWITGDDSGGLAQSLKRLVDTRGLSHAVEFKGHVTGSDKKLLLDEADVLLHPSENENFGVGIAEALAVGMPAVVSASSAMAEFVRQGAGVVIAQPNALNMAEAVEHLLTDPADYANRSSTAMQVVRDELGWEAVAERWTTALHRVVESVGVNPQRRRR